MADLFYDSLETSRVIWKFESSTGFQICDHRREEDPRNFNENREEGPDQKTYKNGAGVLLRTSTLGFVRKWKPCVYTSEEVWVGQIRPKGHFQLRKTELFEAMVYLHQLNRRERQPPKASSTLPSTACLAREAMLGGGEHLPHLPLLRSISYLFTEGWAGSYWGHIWMMQQDSYQQRTDARICLTQQIIKWSQCYVNSY